MDPSLEMLAKQLSDNYKDPHESTCAPIKVDIISVSTRSFATVQPREFVATTSNLENQYSRFSTFKRRYRDLQIELSRSLSIWQEHKDLNLDLFFSGSFKYLLFDNIGWNYLTLILMLAAIPTVGFLTYMAYKLYYHTVRRGSCLRHWTSKFKKKVLRKGKRRNRKMKNQRVFEEDEEGIEMRRNDEEEPDMDERNQALVPYRRREARPVRGGYPALM